jgi:predicted MPP superfamily phosphohydrolase
VYRILEISDTHCGSRLGLTPPGYADLTAQQWLNDFWDFYTTKCAEVGPVDALILNGDMIDGQGYKDNKHHITTDMHKQTDMAIEVARVPDAGAVYMVKGSGYHVDGGAEFEEYIGDALDTVAEPELRLEVAGRKLQFRHHVGRSDTPYGQYTQVGKELINEMLQSALEEYESADLLGRSHVHYYVEVGMADGSRGVVRKAFTSPALQLRGPEQSSFVNRLRTWMYHVGMTLIEIDEQSGEIYLRPILYPIKNYFRRPYKCLTKGKR